MANKNERKKESPNQPLLRRGFGEQTTNQLYSPISQAVEELEKNLAEVLNATAWAELLNLSREYFSKMIKQHYGVTASSLLRFIRYKQLKKVILNNPHETAYAIAGRVGLKDDQALYIFLNYHYNTNFTELRNELLNGEGKPEK